MHSPNDTVPFSSYSGHGKDKTIKLGLFHSLQMMFDRETTPFMQVISLFGAQKAILHPDDMLLLSNFVLSSESFRYEGEVMSLGVIFAMSVSKIVELFNSLRLSFHIIYILEHFF